MAHVRLLSVAGLRNFGIGVFNSLRNVAFEYMLMAKCYLFPGLTYKYLLSFKEHGPDQVKNME